MRKRDGFTLLALAGAFMYGGIVATWNAPAAAAESTARVELTLRLNATGEADGIVCWKLDGGELYVNAACRLVEVDGNATWRRVER